MNEPLRYNATATAMELVANVLDRPDEPVVVTISDKDEAGQVIMSLAGLAASWLSQVEDGFSDDELAGSMRSMAGVLRTIEAL